MSATERFGLDNPVLLTRGKLMVAGTIMGVGLAGTILAFAVIALKINNIQQEEIHNNTQAIGNVRRIQRLERPPTQRQLAIAAATALRACARDAACRNQFRLVVLRAHVKTSDLPDLGPLTKRLKRHTTGGSSGSSSGSGGGSSGTTGGGSGGSDPGGTARPPARRSPPASAPAPTKPTPSGHGSPAAPTEPPAVPPPPAAPVPPVNVQIPPVPPLPPVPPVCTPVLGVNCPR